MPSFNKVILMGNLTRDPQLKHLPNDLSVTEFGLAVNHKFKTKSGESREDVLFVDCSAFGKTGEIIHEHLTKGKPVLVEGRLKLDSWEDKNGGGKRSKISVVVDGFQFIGGKDAQSDGDDSDEQPPQAVKPAARPNVPGQKLHPANRPGRGPDGPVATRQDAFSETTFNPEDIPF